ncbi:MAG: malate synthase G, partial [Rhodoferax sp.]|nr:malate synthase G [Rhodoferax sp.]
MTERITKNGLQVAANLSQFIDTEVLPGTGVSANAFWQGFGNLVADLAPKNIALLAERDRLQSELDAWHKANPGPITAGDSSKPSDMANYRAFLEGIGYLVEPPKKAKISTKNVDAELAVQ